MFKRALATSVVLVWLGATACGGGGDNTRTVLVDYSSDRYATFSLFNFPKKVAVEPGTTLVFRQTWTGEPHTVTAGTAVNAPLAKAQPLLDFFLTYEGLVAQGAKLPDPDSEESGAMKFTDFAKAIKQLEPAGTRDKMITAWAKIRSQGAKLPDLDKPTNLTFGDVGKAVDEYANTVFADVPFAFNEESGGIQQNYGQPCYLRQGMPPKDQNKPCSKSQQAQPAFDGTQSFYSSGIIRYEGQQGNTFRVPLSENIKPGTYTFYCAVHGPQQATEVEVRAKGADVPSQEDVTRETRKEIDEVIKPLDEVWTDARDGNVTMDEGGEKRTLAGPFAGLFSPKATHAAINEFVPKNLTVKANAPIAWKMMAADHTVSFGVPSYFPPVEFLKDGTVRINPKLEPAAGGARQRPKENEGDGPPGGGGGIQKFDGGTYGGTGFWSSGLIGGEPYLEYTMRISKPGRYRVACLIHPPMVGNVTVTA